VEGSTSGLLQMSNDRPGQAIELDAIHLHCSETT
jgi:hypothetical protein